LKDLISKSGKYLAIMVYLNREADVEILRVARSDCKKESNIGVTFGWGPRFLHSTGQFHKGGAQAMVRFLQITAEPENADIEIPGQDFSLSVIY
jgi:glucose-6-phosphate isomerase